MLSWWKIVCIVLLAYTVAMGLLLPLSPGIAKISQETVRKGRKAEVGITGFNTHFRESGGSLKAWVKGGEELYCCDVDLTDDEDMSVSFVIPSSTNRYSYDLIVNNDKDGTIYYANSIHLNSDSDTSQAVAASVNCSYEVKNEHASFLSFPNREMLNETIRNLYFHVPMWFSMIAMVIISIIFSIRYLSSEQQRFDHIAEESGDR